jgi:hypothetical protein
VDFRGVYVAFTRACVILEEIIPEHGDFNDYSSEGYDIFDEVGPIHQRKRRD